MAKKNIIQVKDLDVEINEILSAYHQGINEGVDFYSQKAVEDLAKITKTTAPKGARGSFRRHITSGVKRKTRFATTYAWYVKAPDYRLTHLLVHGHETRNGGRTKGNPFLHNALKQVLPAFEKGVQSVFDYFNEKGGRYHERGIGD